MAKEEYMERSDPEPAFNSKKASEYGLHFLLESDVDDVLRSTDAKYRESRVQYVDRMFAAGYKIVYPGPDELLLDLDSDTHLQYFTFMVNRVIEEYTPKLVGKKVSYKVYSSETPGHYHAHVKLPFVVDDALRTALQSILGSDPVRELLAVFRMLEGDPKPSLLSVKLETRKLVMEG